jgi:hypothetical protein
MESHIFLLAAMKQSLSWSLAILAIAVASLLSTGCKDEAKPYTLVVECDNDIARKSVDVDLIGVTALDKPEWEAYSINKYWQGDDARRKQGGDKLTLQFGIGHTNRYVLNLKDPAVKQRWQSWMGRRVTDLIVIAHLRGVTTDARGNEDPRRKTLPLKSKAIKEIYPDAKAFRILVQDSGVRIDPLDAVPKDTEKK